MTEAEFEARKSILLARLNTQQTSEPQENDKTLAILGYVTAVLLRPVGLILGIVVATRNSSISKHGWRIIVLSIIVPVIYTIILIFVVIGIGTASLNSTSNSAPCITGTDAYGQSIGNSAASCSSQQLKKLANQVANQVANSNNGF